MSVHRGCCLRYGGTGYGTTLKYCPVLHGRKREREVEISGWRGLNLSYLWQASGEKDRPTNHTEYLDYSWNVQCK